MIAPEILTRITYAKFILQQGQDLLLSSSPVADGLSVSLFQDSAEMLLRAIAEHLDANVSQRTSFDEIINSIEKAKNNHDNKIIPSKISISQLNKSRVNFKHYGLLPTKEDTLKFNRDVNIFFQRILEDFLGLNYEDISLSTIVRDQRTKNHLKQAEKHFINSKFGLATEYAAKAFCLATRKTGFFMANATFIGPRSFDNRDLVKAFYKIEKQTNTHEKMLGLIQLGINLADFIYFNKVTPIVDIMASNTLHISRNGRHESNEEVARFCVNFGITSALKVEKITHIIPESYVPKCKREFKVTKVSDIIVYPVPEDKPELLEVIRKTELGEILQGDLEHRDKNDYISILFENETAYINKDAVIGFQK